MSAEDSAGTRRILVVEDEVLLALTLEDYLVAAGWTVVGPYSDLRTGMSAANRETFDVALLDVNLNGEMVFPLAEALLGAAGAARPVDGLFGVQPAGTSPGGAAPRQALRGAYAGELSRSARQGRAAERGIVKAIRAAHRRVAIQIV